MRTWANEMITANGIEMKWPRGGLSRKGKLKRPLLERSPCVDATPISFQYVQPFPLIPDLSSSQ